MGSTHNVLYLGIDAPPHVFHYPVIQTKRIDSPELEKAKSLWSECTHILFTSKNGVRHWPLEIVGKKAIAIGDATAQEVSIRGVKPYIAPFATQEGVVALLSQMNLEEGLILYPRSRLARPYLGNYLVEKNISHYAFDLYDTIFQKPEPIPDLNDFEEIVFTSPSTVYAFYQIFPSVPDRILLTPIGPITKKALDEYFFPKDMGVRL